MNAATKASHEYLKNTVMTARPEQLHLMLLDGAIRFVLQGREAIEQQDREATFNALERAQRIILQMHAGLQRDVNPTLVDQVSSVYSFIYRRLIDANVHQDVEACDEALRIIRHQRETWVMLMEKLAREGNEDQPPIATATPPADAGDTAAPPKPAPGAPRIVRPANPAANAFQQPKSSPATPSISIEG